MLVHLAKQTIRPNETPSRCAAAAYPMNRFVRAMTRPVCPNALAKQTFPAYGMAMRLLLPMLMLSLSACNGHDKPAADSPGTNVDTPTTLNPGAQPVTVGENGAGVAACIARGRVVNLSPGGQPYLPVRAAPFAEAIETARLTNGARVFVCSRSINQAWRGIIIPPADHPDADCGVTAPIASAQPYAGPCQSGWVANAFLELTGN